MHIAGFHTGSLASAKRARQVVFLKQDDQKPALNTSLKGALGLIAAIALVTLIFGWGLGYEFFIRVRPDFAAMVPSTALAFLALSLGLLPLVRTSLGKTSQRVLSIVAIAVVAIAVLDLAILVADRAAGIDSVLWPDLLQRPSDGMAAATAGSFILASICCILLGAHGTPAKLSFVTASTLGLLLSSIALVGYALDTEALYGVFLFTAMSLHTALAFAILFVSLMLIARDRGWIWLLFEERTGSAGARRLVPLVLGGPFLLCLLTLFATDAGIFSANFRLSILAIAMMLIGTIAVLRNAAIENRAEEETKALMADLEVALQDRSLLLREVYHRVKNNLQQINAMLMIEKTKIGDPEAIEAFGAMSGRIQALGMVHQLLLQADTPSEVDLSDYFEKLTQNLAAGHGLDRRGIRLTIEAISERAYLDVAMTLGLLINELVANAIEHAFRNENTGTIAITYGREGESERILTVSDDGSGYSQQAAEHTGSLIISSLIRQLRARKSVTNGNGTTVTVVFPANLSEEIRYANS